MAGFYSGVDKRPKGSGDGCPALYLWLIPRAEEGEVMAKQLSRQSARRIELTSLNQAHPDRSLDVEDIDWMARIVWASQ